MAEGKQFAVFVGSLNQPQGPLREGMTGKQTTAFCDKCPQAAKCDVDRQERVLP